MAIRVSNETENRTCSGKDGFTFKRWFPALNISPKDGRGAALILPKCNTYAMNLHLAEIARNIAPAAHAVVLLDQAGWHMTNKLNVPPNVTIMPLPAKCPEPTEKRLAVPA